MSVDLGIDIGSTSIKICLVQGTTLVDSHKVVHNATTQPAHRSCDSIHEQDPRIILTVLDGCLKHLFENNHCSGVSSIHVTGQMHGVILWKRRSVQSEVLGSDLTSLYHAHVERTSNLITWQDQRCGSAFLDQFPPSPTLCNISTGFGIASMAWLQKEYDCLKEYDMCGTIMDFVVWLLMLTDHVAMTSHNANSWGYFDIRDGSWVRQSIQQLNIPLHLLPNIVATGDPIGDLKYPVHGLEVGVKVFPALGDLQCSISALSSSSASNAVLNIGTSSQLSFIAEFQHQRMKHLIITNPGVSIVPYKGTQVIVTAASLSGGNVLTSFVENIKSWMIELGCSDIPSDESMFAKLQQAAVKHQESEFTTSNRSLQINPTMFGERYNPAITATVGNISASNCTLGGIVWSIYRGLIQNLFGMLPVEILMENAVNGIRTTESLAKGNDALLKHVAEISGMDIVPSCEDEDAAFGAVMFSRLS